MCVSSSTAKYGVSQSRVGLNVECPLLAVEVIIHTSPFCPCHPHFPGPSHTSSPDPWADLHCRIPAIGRPCREGSSSRPPQGSPPAGRAADGSPRQGGWDQDLTARPREFARRQPGSQLWAPPPSGRSVRLSSRAEDLLDSWSDTARNPLQRHPRAHGNKRRKPASTPTCQGPAPTSINAASPIIRSLPARPGPKITTGRELSPGTLWCPSPFRGSGTPSD